LTEAGGASPSRPLGCDHGFVAAHQSSRLIPLLDRTQAPGRLQRLRQALEIRYRLSGWLASLALVAVVTGAIQLLEPHVPVLSLGVLYLFAVIPVAVVWGLAYAIPVSIGSMLVFNWFFLPPVHTFTLADSRNWFALGVFLVTAVVVSELAARSRRQARESALLAEIATSLLKRGEVSGELERIAVESAQALQVERARIELGEPAIPVAGAGEPFPLTVEGRRLGTIYLERPRRGGAAARRRVLPALASLLGIAVDREQLAREALEAEALRRSDAMKTAVLRAVSHDLRTPLMAILTSASALAREDLELGREDRAELATTILSEAERLDRLVANLLDLSRLQAGAAQPQPDVWPVDDLVLQALDDVGEAGRRVQVSFPDDSPLVLADAHQVERALVNLLENALKYSPASEPVHVQVSMTPGEILVRIVDHGPGIAPGDRERIFEAFQRGADGRVRGAGLGLAIARGFAEANGGRLWAESRAGQGAAFVLALPAEKEPAL
jgi:two-component system, OmpR family, sensor histidine kinase KdpD